MTVFPLPHEPSSAGIARGHLRTALAGWGTPERVEDAMLLVTELVANAVIHGSADVELDVDVSDSLVCVRVTDRSPVIPRQPSAGTAGRGLAIVDALSDKWGVEALPSPRDGKAVWFELKG